MTADRENAGASQQTSTSGWSKALVSLLLAVLVQLIVLPCLCEVGSYSMIAALLMDSVVAIPIAYHGLKRHSDKGSMFYYILPQLIAPLLLIVREFIH